MMTWAAHLIDHSVVLLWTASLHLTVLATALLIPLVLWRRRPAIRHFLALAALAGVVAAPFSAALSNALGRCWLPLPASLFPQVRSHAEQPLAAAHRPATPPFPNDSPLNESPAALPRGAASIAEPRPGDSTARVPIEASDAVHPAPATDAEKYAGAREIGPLPIDEPSESQPAYPHQKDRVVPVGPHSTATESGAAIGSYWSAACAQRLLFLFWLAGAAVYVLRIRRTRARLLRLMAETRVIVDQGILAILDGAARSLELRLPVKLLASPSVANPFVFGLPKPSAVVPVALLAAGQESRLAHVLLHELAHIARGDLWIGLLQQWAGALGWFHPLVHLHSRLLSEAREELCDNLVLVNVSPPDYARTLLQMGELAAGLTSPTAVSMLSGRPTLESRISRLLEPRRDRATRLGWRQSIALGSLVSVLAVAAAGIGTGETSRAAAQNADSTVKTPIAALDPTENAAQAAGAAAPSDEDFVSRLAERVAYFLKPAAGVKTLEYDFSLGAKAIPVKVQQGDERPIAVWQGTTLHGGLHELLHAPSKFDIKIERPARAGAEITIRATPKAADAIIRFSAGNGIEASWRGFFSHGARETTISVDAQRLVPLKEQTGASTILYQDWIEVEPERWIPRQIDVVHSRTRYRMQFDWLGESIWLLRRSESISPDATATLTRVSNVRINGQPVMQTASEQESQSRATDRALLEMLDHNRPWLDQGDAGAGWKPPFETLSYAFHTEREDVGETCVLDRDGLAVIEVARDGKGMMVVRASHPSEQGSRLHRSPPQRTAARNANQR